ncbi:MAG: hypothetical protein KDN22_12560 [Verrucomicrobiae bacterium]|nr:hypothetical protein [Verrucomicrobiae bacterium]
MRWNCLPPVEKAALTDLYTATEGDHWGSIFGNRDNVIRGWFIEDENVGTTMITVRSRLETFSGTDLQLSSAG